MSILELSDKGKALIKLYENMANEGYQRTDNTIISNAFSDFELRPFRGEIKPILAQYEIKSVLDYGCGGSNWEDLGFDDQTGMSAKQFFELEETLRYEPARGIDERRKVDCVVNFDVLEHVFISDVPVVIRDILSHASKLAVINVACYPAAAKLPNGENAHITVRPPFWWKGMIDCLAPEFPDVSIVLYCSKGYRQAGLFPIFSNEKWQASPTYVTLD